ncbi:MAG: hypothetical protein ACJAUV_001742 [Flavobacteriales bacterium]|jgi:hypothetical protein
MMKFLRLELGINNKYFYELKITPMKNIFVLALGAILLTTACKKIVKNDPIDSSDGNNPPSSNQLFTASVNGTVVTMPFSFYSYNEIDSMKSISISSVDYNSQSIGFGANVTQKGQIGAMSDVVFSYLKSEDDNGVGTTEGMLNISSWDTINELVSGTFSFTITDSMNNVVIENGVFTNVTSL